MFCTADWARFLKRTPEKDVVALNETMKSDLFHQAVEASLAQLAIAGGSAEHIYGARRFAENLLNICEPEQKAEKLPVRTLNNP